MDKLEYEAPAVVRHDKLNASPSWYTIAWGEIGNREIPGSKTNPRIREYLKTCSNLSRAAWSKDETPWCSGFVNWNIEEAGYIGTKHALAKSWAAWGFEVGPVEEAPRGSIVVLQKRGNPIGGKGYHVTFLNHVEQHLLEGLGGNQSDQVQLSWYDLQEWNVRGCKWPWNLADQALVHAPWSSSR